MMMYFKSREEEEGTRERECVHIVYVDDDTIVVLPIEWDEVAGSSEISRSVGREITGTEYVQIPLHSRRRKMEGTK